MATSDDTRVIPRRSVASWILFDLANVIFSMGVTSVYFSLFVRTQVGSERADSLLRPDQRGVDGHHVLLLAAAWRDDRPRAQADAVSRVGTIICCAATALFARGPFALSALLFVIANGGYQAGVQFYDSLLPEVTTERNRGRINGIAIGLGYIGSYIAVGVRTSDVLDAAAIPVRQLLPVRRGGLLRPCDSVLPVRARARATPNPRPIFTRALSRSRCATRLQTLRSDISSRASCVSSWVAPSTRMRSTR